MQLRDFLKELAEGEMDDKVVIYDAEYSLILDIGRVFIEDGHIYLDIEVEKEKAHNELQLGSQS